MNKYVAQPGAGTQSPDTHSHNACDEPARSVMAGSRRTCIPFVVAAVFGALTWVGTVLAQEEAESQNVMEEITVTAERRATTLQETPLSIVAFNQEMLDTKVVDTVEDLADFVPGLSIAGDVEGGSSRPIFVIRGIGQSSGRDTIERGVGLYIDDVYIPRVTGTYLQLIDTERVEVLRGPQGTLFGRNSTGGAIRYFTRKPTQDFEGFARATLGSYNRIDVDGLVNIPLGDKVALRVQAGSFYRDGYVEGVINGLNRGDQNEQIARAALRIWATDSVTIDASVGYQQSKSFGPALKPITFGAASVHGGALSNHLVSLGQPPLVDNDPRIVNSDFYKWNDNCYLGVNKAGFIINDGRNFFADTQSFCDYHVDIDNLLASLDINAELTDSLSFRSITGYVNGNADQNNDWAAMGTFAANEVSDYSSFSQEFQLAYEADNMHIVGGLIYFEESPALTSRMANIQFFPIPPAGIDVGDCCWGFIRLRDASTKSYGAFAQGTFDLGESFSLIVGARYSNDDKRLTISRTDRVTSPSTGSDSWSSTDYRVTLQYTANDDLMFYGTYSTGFKAGGFNDSLSASPTTPNGGVVPYTPEEVTNFEVGTKTQFLNNRLTLNADYFWANYKDIQLTTPVFFPGDPVGQLIIANAGEVDLDGLEVDLHWQATDNLRFDGGLATLNQDFVSLLPGSALIDPAVPCVDPVNDPGSCHVQDIARAPQLQYFVGATLNTSLDSGEIVWSATYSWSDGYESSNSFSNNYTVDSYGTANVRAEYAPADANWAVSVFCTNVTGEKYYTSGTDFNAGGFFSPITVAPGRPREFGVRLRYDF